MGNDTDDFAVKARASVADAIIKLTGGNPSNAGVDAKDGVDTKAARPTEPSSAIGRARRTGTIHLKH
jgi:hypothetical protein